MNLNGDLTIYLFAGSNGAGKTTFARAYLRQIELHYLWIPSPALAIRRIRQRGWGQMRR